MQNEVGQPLAMYGTKFTFALLFPQPFQSSENN
jgi:hypothetical protein